MFTLNIPELMEGELLYSFLVRLAEYNSLTIDALARYFILDEGTEMTNRKRVLLSIGSVVFMPRLANILDVSPLDLFLNNTVFPGTAPLQLPGKQSRVINFAFRKNGFRYPNLIGRPQSDVEALKYCPVCHEEDMHKYGYSWLRREHHMPHVNACWKHGVKLVKMEYDSRHPANQLVFPKMKATTADDIETRYAGFASDFLNARLDMNRIISKKLILQGLENRNPSDEFDRNIEKILNKDMESFFSEIKKRHKYFEDWKILAGLFAVYPNVSKIPVIKDTETENRFISCLNGYELLSDYSGTCVELRKQGEDNSFIVTPSGFISGWRSPSEDSKTEQEKYAQIFSNISNGEFETVDSFDCSSGSIRVVHKKCGKIFPVKPKDIVETGLHCPCQEKSVLNINFSRKKVESSGAFELLSVSEGKILTVRALDCGHVFDISYAAWCKLQECRICDQTRIQQSQFRYKSAEADSVYNAGAAFKQEVLDIVGEEYEVIGEYKNACTPIFIRHKKCGCVKKYVPVGFLHGARCGCDRGRIPNGAEFLEYVGIRSCGLYEITGSDLSKRYLVRNKQTGEIKAMYKAYIVQEIERPTLSSVLPLKTKGEYGNPFDARLSKVKHIIESCYQNGQIFSIEKLLNFGISQKKLIPILKELCKEGFIEKKKGTDYRYIGRSV